jgi:ParB family chromosome partitioning protein
MEGVRGSIALPPTGQNQALLALSAAGHTVNAVQASGHQPEALSHADVLAPEIGLDMANYWQPTAASYFGRVSKERIVRAVREGGSEHEAQKIAGIKKPAMADAAGREGWLPQLLWISVSA